MRIVQIVPRRPPPPEGVGSYAEALAAALYEAHGIESRFVVRTEGLEEALDGSPVLLHYVSYGYHPRGCPKELVAKVTRLRLDELLAFGHGYPELEVGLDLRRVLGPLVEQPDSMFGVSIRGDGVDQLVGRDLDLLKSVSAQSRVCAVRKQHVVRRELGADVDDRRRKSAVDDQDGALDGMRNRDVPRERIGALEHHPAYWAWVSGR